MRMIRMALAVVLLVALFAGCGSTSAQLRSPKKGDTVAVLKTSMGDIHIRMMPEVAPKAVENFTTHAKNGYYDGLIFHRVMSDFMIQGGDPLGTGMGGESIWGSPFEDEFSMEAFHFRGALSMANSGGNTNGSQFFIVHAGQQTLGEDAKTIEEMMVAGGWPEDAAKSYAKLGGTPHLDHRHTVFGQVYMGMEVLDRIAAVQTDAEDRPLEEVLIQTIVVSEFGS